MNAQIGWASAQAREHYGYREIRELLNWGLERAEIANTAIVRRSINWD